MISLQRQFLYVHIPKTGGNSVQNVLREYSEDRIVCVDPHHDGVERFGLRSERFNVTKHSLLRDYHRELGPELFGKLFKFCCVRNPWERAISFYFSPHRQRTGFDRADFLQSLERLIPVTEFLALDGGPASPFNNVDSIMRLERLDEDFRAVCQRLEIPFTPLPVRNKSSRAHYSTYYDSELVEIVRARYAGEVEHFRYRFNES